MGDGLPHVELDLVLQIYVLHKVIDDVCLHLVRLMRPSLSLLITNLFYSLHYNYYIPTTTRPHHFSPPPHSQTPPSPTTPKTKRL